MAGCFTYFVTLPLRPRVDAVRMVDTSIYHAPCSVADQCTAKAAALIRAINSEPREYNNRDWLGHIAPETPRRCGKMDRASGQGIIADDFVRIAHHECSRRAAGLIGKCAQFSTTHRAKPHLR